MTTIPQVAKAMQTLLSSVADDAARRTGFVQRRSKVSGAIFVRTLVLGWLHQPQATLDGLTQTTAAQGVSLTPQGLDQRFTPAAVRCLEEVLASALTTVVTADPVPIPLLQRFRAVWVHDSTTIALPAALASVWPGSGGRPGQGEAALKLQVRLDLLTGTLEGPLLEPGRTQDKASPFQTAPTSPGALRLADLGYFSLDVFQALDQQGSFFLSRYQVQTAVHDPAGQRLDLVRLLAQAKGAPLDLAIRLGAQHRLPCRLLAVRVPPQVAAARRRDLHRDARRRGQAVSQRRLRLADWTVLVTNVPVTLLSLEEAMVLARARWQIELLFKLWKQHGYLDEWRSSKPQRIHCEVAAKLIALVLQHWLLLVSGWTLPDRSWVKAARTIRSYAVLLGSALAGQLALVAAIAHLRACVLAGCRMNRRKRHPNTYQLLLDPALAA